MDFVFGGQRGHFLGRREQRPDLHVEAQIGEGRGDDLLSAVVAVLAHLGDQNAGTTALVFGEGAGQRDHPLVGFGGGPGLGEIDAGNGPDLGDDGGRTPSPSQARFRRPSPWPAPPRPTVAGGWPFPRAAAGQRLEGGLRRRFVAFGAQAP